jgi:hypothetical protein
MARVTNDPEMNDPVVDEPVVVERKPAARRNVVVDDDVDTRDEIRAAERSQFGGIKFGSAFFGWLTASGLAVLLTALVAAIGTAAGLSAEDVGDGVARVTTLGIAGAIGAAIVVFIAYFAGGYVAGRMARFSGAAQGFAVWLWAIIIAILAALLGWALGDRFNILGNLDAFPRIPNADELTVPGIITAVVLALIPLLAAVLGGMAGMRYHRRVDRAGLDDTVVE